MKGQNLYFSAVFSKLLDEWLAEYTTNEYGEKKKRTQADFARQCGNIHPNMITRYKKGEAFPSESILQCIADFFNVEIDTFFPTTEAEKLAFDLDYREKAFSEILDLEYQMIQEMGIDLGFWKFFTSIEGIYDLFPFENHDQWTTDMIQGKKNSKGQKVGFTKNDLLFVKQLQHEAETTISVLLIKELLKKGRYTT